MHGNLKWISAERTQEIQTSVYRFEARSEAFHEAVRQAYLELAERDARVQVVDANGPVDTVQAQLQEATQALLAEVGS